VLFFFSSRRRHTRFDCDWSSDVCSSDLDPPGKPRGDRPTSYLRRLYSFGGVGAAETSGAGGGSVGACFFGRPVFRGFKPKSFSRPLCGPWTAFRAWLRRLNSSSPAAKIAVR